MSTIAEITPTQRVLAECRNDPHRFHEVYLSRRNPSGQRLRPSYWRRQIEIGKSVVKYRTTAVYSGNAIGKDYLVGGLILWWLYTRPQSLVIVTGPTQTVLGSVTWREIRKAASALILPPPRISTGIKASPAVVEISPGWNALGFSTTSIERASGQHNQHLLVIVEEASGVEDEIWDAVDSYNYNRLLAIGNPIRPDGRFIELIRQAEKDRAEQIAPHLAVNAIQIPSTESPHAHLERSPYGLADKTWLEASYRKYGRNSLWVGSHIDAKIPDVSADQLIPIAWLDYHRSQSRSITPYNHPIHATRRIACDLSEGVGRDSTCVMVVDRWGVLEVVLGSGMGLPEAAETIHRLAAKWKIPHDRITYDKLGIGRNFPNHLARWGITTAVPYAGEGRPQDKNSFTNLRTECGWKLRNRLDVTHQLAESGATYQQSPFCFCPGEYYSRLVEELRPLTYSLIGRKTKLLPKDEWADCLGHSPDVADALIQSMLLEK